MAPPTRTPRAVWIEVGLRALAEGGGPGAVRVDTLAKSLGVTRGGFYGQFKDRGALLEAMLDTWERAATDEVLEQVERRGGDARAKVRRAGALTFSAELLPVDLAIRDWARHDSDVAARLAGWTTGGWNTCASCSVHSLPTRTRSKVARCSRSHSRSATTSSPPTTVVTAARMRSSSPSGSCLPERSPLLAGCIR